MGDQVIMVRYWCNTCNEEHDNARDCPAYVKPSRSDGKELRKLTDHQRRQRKADYRAPKGSNNAVESGCAVVTLVLIGGLASIPVGAWYFFG
jgi:hypothetical protein